MSLTAPLVVVGSVLALLLAALAGLVAGRRTRGRSTGAPAPVESAAPRSEPPDQVSTLGDVLQVLASAAVVVDSADAVVAASPTARVKGFVRGADLTQDRLRDLVRQVRRDGVVREVEMELPRGLQGEGLVVVGARVARLDGGHVLLLVEDHTHAAQVEQTRRDFVANVSHELKTPVGGIALLAEAVLDAKDDPEAVGRFARRIVIESNRLTRLVREIVDLSRLQSSEALVDPEPVSVRSVVQEAMEMTSALAEGRDIAYALAVEDDPIVYGDAQLLRTAVSNLLSNAVTYSGEGTRVAISVREIDGTVEIAVADQGTGISKADQPRVFERFYRVDAARSRATGGTGLGLAIVKHICSNHGGDITLWSSPGHGSTFTMRLPSAAEHPGDDAPAPHVTDPRSGDRRDGDTTHREETR